jgi:hypothetical protein
MVGARQNIDLVTPLSLKSAFLFPIQSRDSRREVIWGGLLLLLPFLGWLLNMGHRMAMTHRMQHGQSAWPAWRRYGSLLRHGVVTFLGMVEYFAPAVACGAIGWRIQSVSLLVIAAVLWIVATMAVPGYMTHYCYSLDAREVFNPFRALRRVLEGGRAYWHAWLIVLAALGPSFLVLCLMKT